ncbi:unnamed protein product [Adineta ricciae]|uniref:Uncharacterized protein n=1 Tax=Adineta ricciae TaxID=249248 RepID=A0A815E0X2_ADIRI|nr:unnamed protein product [Adineta ricciae]
MAHLTSSRPTLLMSFFQLLEIRLLGPTPTWSRTNDGDAGLHPSNIHDCQYAIGNELISTLTSSSDLSFPAAKQSFQCIVEELEETEDQGDHYILIEYGSMNLDLHDRFLVHCLMKQIQSTEFSSYHLVSALFKFFDQVRFYPVDEHELEIQRQAFQDGRLQIGISISNFLEKRDEAFNKEFSLWKNGFEAQNDHDSEVNDEIPDDDGVTKLIRSDVCRNVWKLLVEENAEVKVDSPLIITRSHDNGISNSFTGQWNGPINSLPSWTVHHNK